MRIKNRVQIRCLTVQMGRLSLPNILEGLFLLKNIDLFAFSLSLQYPEIHQHYFRIEVKNLQLAPNLIVPVVAQNRLVGTVYISKERTLIPVIPNFRSDLVEMSSRKFY